MAHLETRGYTATIRAHELFTDDVTDVLEELKASFDDGKNVFLYIANGALSTVQLFFIKFRRPLGLQFSVTAQAYFVLRIKVSCFLRDKRFSFDWTALTFNGDC